MASQRVRRLVTVFIGVIFVIPAIGEEKRAKAPQFSKDDTQGIFFDSVADAVRGQRPSLANLRKRSPSAVAAGGGNPLKETDDSDGGTWDKLISPQSLEDEVKRVKLHYDSVVTQPGPFKSGGYQDARLDLMVLSSMFAIIADHSGDVRWKKDAAAARDLLGRTAYNCNAGTTQVFNEARARKDDLQSLMSGSGLRSAKAEEDFDWSSIADRGPLMEYAEMIRDTLREDSASEDAITADPDAVRRNGELIAILGKILAAEGMDDADDEDYAAFCEQMTRAANGVKRGMDLKDYDAVRKAVGAITQSCDACHEQYR